METFYPFELLPYCPECGSKGRTMDETARKAHCKTCYAVIPTYEEYARKESRKRLEAMLELSAWM